MLGHLALLGLAAWALKPRYKLVVDTYEGDSTTPVLTHTFYGSNAAQAEAIRQAHMRYDVFLASCERGRFQGRSGSFACRNVIRSR